MMLHLPHAQHQDGHHSTVGSLPCAAVDLSWHSWRRRFVDTHTHARTRTYAQFTNNYAAHTRC